MRQATIFLYLSVIVFFIYVPLDVEGQRLRLNRPHEVRAVFYNVENLFDIYDEPGKNDVMFTPEGRNKWTAERYEKKVKDLGKVINEMGGDKHLALIGLCEVENMLVLTDLAMEIFERERDFSIIHRNSADARGIDVALIYDNRFFTLLSKEFIAVEPEEFPQMRTRDILYAKGILSDADTLHVYLNHWSSRRGGLAETEPRRVAAAEILRSHVDEVLARNSAANILIMGDFNDEPDNKSVKETLRAKPVEQAYEDGMLFNLVYDYVHRDDIGTYKFRGNWNMLDHMIASRGLLDAGSQIHIPTKKALIFKEDWLFTEDERFGGKTIFRTYGGPNYLGGYSDHLPIYTDIQIIPTSRRGR